VLGEDFRHGQGDDDFEAALDEQFIGMGWTGVGRVSARRTFPRPPPQPRTANERAVVFTQQPARQIQRIVGNSPGRSRTAKPRPARQSGSLSGNAQTPRWRLAMAHWHGRNINANPTL